MKKILLQIIAIFIFAPLIAQNGNSINLGFINKRSFDGHYIQSLVSIGAQKQIANGKYILLNTSIGLPTNYPKSYDFKDTILDVIRNKYWGNPIGDNPSTYVLNNTMPKYNLNFQIETQISLIKNRQNSWLDFYLSPSINLEYHSAYEQYLRKYNVLNIYTINDLFSSEEHYVMEQITKKNKVNSNILFGLGLKVGFEFKIKSIKIDTQIGFGKNIGKNNSTVIGYKNIEGYNPSAFTYYYRLCVGYLF